MHDSFLRAIVANPKDDTSRLIYADWLEEQGDADSAAKAEFLRKTVELARQRGQRDQRRWRKETRNCLQQLAAQLDTSWLAAVSHLDIENCQGKRAEVEPPQSYPIRFDYVCDRRWEDLQPTSDRTVRFCDSCRQNVHYCDTIGQARDHARAFIA